MSDFVPLTAPRVQTGRTEPAEPVSWYQRVAPKFPEQKRAAEPISDDGSVDEKGRALFGSIDAIAGSERRRRMQGEPEPAEIRLIRESAAAQADAIVEEARSQAVTILEESRTSGYRQGYDSGYSAGFAEATRQLTQQAQDEREACRRDLTNFIEQVETMSRRTVLEMEPEIIGLVFEIARKVIKMEVDLNRQAAIELVKNTLRRVADSATIRIRVHSDDLQTVRANREELYTLVDSIRHVEVVEDRRVGTGGCIVETDAGTIDARIETQIEEVRKLLEQASADRNLRGEAGARERPQHAG